MAGTRFDRLDALRGAALVWMAAFHFSFDLDHFGLLAHPQHFRSNPLWTTQRVCILSLFLLCAGMGQAIAIECRQGARRFLRRWAQVAGCALLVSVGSAIMFPASWISFGVLHGIAAMLLLCRLAVPAGAGALASAVLAILGAVAIGLPGLVHSPWFDSRWTNWVGLVAHRPDTEDWVPLLPWLGVMLWGVVAGQWLLRARRPLLAGALPAAAWPLALLGRWSLAFYMVHQLVFIGALQGGRSLGWW